MAMSVSLDLQVAEGLEGLPNEEQIGDWVTEAVAAATREHPFDAVEYDIAMRLVDRDEIQALNLRYRQQDKPTNVLSFPFERLDGLPADALRSLGDIVICGPVVTDEAEQQGKVGQEHWAHIVIHGTLHLLGYDHQDDEQATSMEALETRVLGRFGIENPYRKK